MSNDQPDTAAPNSNIRIDILSTPPVSAKRLPLDWPIGIWFAVGFLFLVTLHLFFSKGVVGPTVTHDEIGYIGNARLLSGYRPVAEMVTGPVYAWGYSLFIVPLVWIFGDDPVALFRGAQVVNALLMAAIFPLSYVFLRRVIGFGQQSCLLGALVAAVYPSVLVTSGSAWSENLLAPLTIAWAISVPVTLSNEIRPMWQRLLIVPATLLLHVSHPRYLVLVALCILGFIVAGLMGLITRRLAISGTAALIIGWLAGRMITAWIAAERWPGVTADKGSSGRLIGRLLTPSYLPKTAAGMAGQGWYLAVGSLGLAVTGALVILWIVFGKTRYGSDNKPIALSFIGLGFGALFTTSVLSFVTSNPRVDTLIYGRYNESFVPFLVAVGFAGFVNAGPNERRRLLQATFGLTILLTTVLVAARGPRFFYGETVWNNLLAIYAPIKLFGLTLAVPGTTAFAVVMLLVGAAFAARQHERVAAILVGSIFVAFAFSSLQPVESFSHDLYGDWKFIPELERVIRNTNVKVIGLDTTDASPHARYTYNFWMPKVLFSARVAGEARVYNPDLIVGVPDRYPGKPEGNLEWADAAVVAVDGRNNQAIWVRPGSAYARLGPAGALLPPNWTEERPLEHLRATITFKNEAPSSSVRPWDNRLIQPAAADCNDPYYSDSSNHSIYKIEVESGKSTAVCIQVTNSDNRYAWPADPNWPALGVVRVGERWFAPTSNVDSDSTNQASESGNQATTRVNEFFEAPYRVPLPHYMWAGDSVTIALPIHAIDNHGESLEPGEYLVGVDMLQEGFRWFSEPGQEPLRLSVTVKPAE